MLAQCQPSCESPPTPPPNRVVVAADVPYCEGTTPAVVLTASWVWRDGADRALVSPTYEGRFFGVNQYVVPPQTSASFTLYLTRSIVGQNVADPGEDLELGTQVLFYREGEAIGADALLATQTITIPFCDQQSGG